MVGTIPCADWILELFYRDRGTGGGMANQAAVRGAWRDWRPWGVLVVLGLCVFSRAVLYPGLELDDAKHIFRNPLLNPPSWTNLGQFWSQPYFSLYIPLTYTFWSIAAWICRAMLPGSPFLPSEPFHALNVMFHIANSVLVFGLLRLWGQIRHTLTSFGAFFGAIVFLVHPAQVEAVCWISCFKDQLCGFLSLACLYSFSLFLDRGGPARSRYYFFALGCFLAACLAKPSAVALPAVIWVLSVGWYKMPWRRAMQVLGVWFVLAAAHAILTSSSQPPLFGFEPAPLWQRPWIAWDALAFYTKQIFFPVSFFLDYGRTPQRLFQEIGFSWFSPLPLLCIGLAWRFRARSEWQMGLGLWLLPLVPVLGFVAFNYQLFSTVSDRYLYLSVLGIAWAVAVLVSRFSKRSARILAGLAVAGLAVKAVDQVGIWKNSETVFRHSLAEYPGSLLLKTNLSAVLFDQGKFMEGLPLLESVIREKPNEFPFRYGIANIYGRLGNLEKAQEHTEVALKLQPYHSGVWVLLGNISFDRGRFDEAKQAYERAATLDPHNRDAKARLRDLASLPKKN